MQLREQMRGLTAAELAAIAPFTFLPPPGMLLTALRLDTEPDVP